jgi:hypothetical protein
LLAHLPGIRQYHSQVIPDRLRNDATSPQGCVESRHGGDQLFNLGIQQRSAASLYAINLIAIVEIPTQVSEFKTANYLR